MNLKGKKINFLGDSITEGYGVEDTENGIYWQQLRDKCELADARPYGIGGTRIAYQKNPSECPAWDRNFISRVDEMDPNADVVVVFGGINDYGHGDAPLGSFCDRTPDTFYGACHVLICKLLERYPNADIVFLTPLHCTYEEGGERSLKEYVDAIRLVAEFYAIPVLDLYAVSGLQPQVPVIQQKFFLDGLHPNDLGHARIYKRLRGFLESL